jgi:hypothetical protein
MNTVVYDKKSMLQVARLDDMREDWKKACKEYQLLADLFPADPFVLEPLSRVQQKLGMVAEWRKTLARAIECYKAMGLPLKAQTAETKLLRVAAEPQA